MDLGAAAHDPLDSPERRRPGGRWLVLALAVLPLTLAATVLRPEMERAWPARYFLPLHAAIETLFTVVAFATFAVQWYAAGARLNDARARFVGSGFLAVALLELGHLLAFPGMPGLVWVGSSTERGIVYWLAARLWTVAILGGALLIRPDSGARALRRGPLVAGALGAVGATLLADVAWMSRRPLFYVEGAGLTSLKKVVEIAIAAAAIAGMVAYHRTRRDTRSAGDVAAALGVTALSEVCFALYVRAYDSFNLLGHVYLLLAAYGVFHALFADAVLRPYERLGAATRELVASNDELRRLREHVEGELDVTIRNLTHLKEEREDLLRAVSHDLRTPLQVVLLQGERLFRLAAGESKERRAAQAILAAGRNMATMIGDLVEAAHLERGKLELSTEPVSIRELVAGLLAMVEGALDTGRVRLEIDGGLPRVPIDVARMGRVLQNLVGNALKYSAPGTAVVVRARAVEREVVVEVSDSSH